MIGGAVMDLEIYQSRGDLYFLVRGRIVLEECERFKSACQPLINKGVEQVIVDLSKSDFIDSAGLGVLVGLKMTANKNKAKIVLLQPSKAVSDVLFISKLDGIFDILTGAEADVLKATLVQPQFRLSTTGERVAERLSSAPLRSFVSSGPEAPPPFPEITNIALTPSEPALAEAPGSGRGQKELIEEHCRKAVEFMRQENYDQSVEAYKTALSIDPDYLPALNNLAIVYEKQPSWIPKAIEQWEHVLRLSQARGDQKHIDRATRHLAHLRRMS